MMKQYLTIILSLFAIYSCATQKREIISKLKVRLEGQNTNIRDFIEIDGYYQSIDSTGQNSGMMFFEDGTAVDFRFEEDITEDMKKANLFQTIVSWTEKGRVTWGGYWGVYKIEEDTIIEQAFNRAGFLNSHWSFSESKFEIIDRQTFKLVYSKSMWKADAQYYINRSPYQISERNYIYKFKPANSLPPSDCWLKEKKWIWRNESDWKAYMEKIK